MDKISIYLSEIYDNLNMYSTQFRRNIMIHFVPLFRKNVPLKILISLNLLTTNSSQASDWWRTPSRSSPFVVEESAYGLQDLFPSREFTYEHEQALNSLWNNALSLYSSHTDHGYHRRSFVYQYLRSALEKVPQYGRIGILSEFSKVLPSIKYGHFDILDTICALSNHPLSASNISSITNLLGDLVDGDHRQLLGRYMVTLGDNLPQLLDVSYTFLKTLQTARDRLQILTFLNRVPTTRQITTLETLKTLFPENTNTFPGPLGHILSVLDHNTLTPLLCNCLLTIFRLSSTSSQFTFTKVLSVSPSDHMQLILEHLLKYTESNDLNIRDKSEIYYLQCLRVESDILKEAYNKHWVKILTTSPNKEEVSYLSDMIINYQYELGVEDNSVLINEALTAATILISDREDDNNPYRTHDPYRIYKSLLESRSISINIPLSSLPKEMLDGKPFCLNTSYFKTLSGLVITNDMLPSFDPNCIKAICKQLKDRLALSPALEDLVQNSIGMSYREVCSGSLDSQYLSDLLTFQRNPNQEVPLTTAKFICIVAHLQKMDNTIHLGTTPVRLTEREDGFLKMGASIFSCPYGKRGGIDDFYTLLPQTSKIKITSASRAHEFIETTLRSEISKMFSGTNLFFQEMISSRSLDILNLPDGATKIQAIHQALQLKNLIGIDVGLWHTLTFDRHAGVLLDAIAEVSKEKAMKLYYQKHFIPANCIEAVLRESNEKLLTDNQLYNDLSLLLPTEGRDAFWEWDDNYKIQLTRQGAIWALLKIGALRWI